MENGVIKKNLSRRFRIKTVEGQDDVKCTEEVITRREIIIWKRKQLRKQFVFPL